MGESKPIQKLRKSGPSGAQDFISSLPNGVIGDILSLLPIKDVVKTCVLSRDWKFKWKNIYNVNIDANKLFRRLWSVEEVFVEVVDRILSHLTNVKLFHLEIKRCRDYEFSCLTAWISEIRSHKIESLELEAFLVHLESDFEYPVLPCSHLSSNVMKNLVLKMPCSFKVAESNSFPKLTRLHLHSIEIGNETSNSEIVMFSFPVLEELELEECKWLKVKFVEIHAPSLTTFTSEISLNSDRNKASSYSIKIIGERLKWFMTGGGYPENIVFADSKVASCEMDYFLIQDSIDECGLGIRKLLRELSHLKSLNIGGALTALANTRLGGISLPRFLKLEDLCVEAPFTDGGLLELLHGASFLHIHLEDVVPYDYDAVDRVPSCIVSHIETLKLDYNLCRKPKLRLAKFFLKYGLQLKNVYIGSDSGKVACKIVKCLSAYPKGSTDVTIENYL